MPKRNDINTILIIGSGPIVIGQACEFDYSGVQACQALKEEGYRVVLVNSNPASIMTDPQFADATYIEPLHEEIIKKIIIEEKVDAVLPTMGGQTALNLAMKLYRSSFLQRSGVILIGATPDMIEKAENRSEFHQLIRKHGLEAPHGMEISSLEEAKTFIGQLNFPLIVRSSFTLGGEGSGFILHVSEFESVVNKALKASPINKAFIEESVFGWKEFELEVMRDSHDNCVIVCSIENIDPMGIHTGDSIAVAPALTLTDKEYQLMRDAALKIMRVVGIESGGANVQFAVNPFTGRMLVIEMNPRVSRSSALASKATGFPIAKIAAKLAVGFTLDEIPNEITKKTSAAFEPSLDYVVVKMPRFDFEKFPDIAPILGTSMKSVGEVMAIGRTFKEAFQKAICSLEKELYGVEEISFQTTDLEQKKQIVREYLKASHPDCYLYIGEAYRLEFEEEEIRNLCKWDPWFLRQIEDIVNFEKEIYFKRENLSKSTLLFAKSIGYSNHRISKIAGISEQQISEKLDKFNIKPVYRCVDSCAAEFDASTTFLYSTYLPYGSSSETEECRPSSAKKVIIIGSGPNHIGQGIEFDYCCVQGALAIRAMGYEAIMINCNPETVSTDYLISDRLYFSPLTSEEVLQIINRESSQGELLGVIIQLGGQTALKLAQILHAHGISILGTPFDSIDLAEDRKRFRQVIEELAFLQPVNRIAYTKNDLVSCGEQVGFPLILRPSYVIGGKFMEIVYNPQELEESTLLKKIDHFKPVLVEQFLDNAIEVEVDAIVDQEKIYIAGITEHFEKAGIHSGDSTAVIPPQTLSEALIEKLCEQTRLLAQKLRIVGFINIQFAIQKGLIYILEVNPRASRSLPFIAKATKTPLAFIGTQVMLKIPLAQFCLKECYEMPTVVVKKPIFSFNRFPSVDPSLGPEMKSTGEVMFQGNSFKDVSLKIHRYGYNLQQGSQTSILIIHTGDPILSEIKTQLENFGFEVVNITHTEVNAEILDSIKKQKFMCIIQLNCQLKSDPIRRKAIHDSCIPEITTYLDLKWLVNSLTNAQDVENIFCLQSEKSNKLEGTACVVSQT